MHNTTHTRARLAMILVVAVVLASLLPATLVAQSAEAAAKPQGWTDPAVATLMLVDNLGATDAYAVVIRRPGDMPNNIVLVTRATTPTQLATAVSALITSRLNKGDRVDHEIRAFVGATPVGPPPSRGKNGDGTPAAKVPGGNLPAEKVAAANPLAAKDTSPKQRTPSEIRAASDLERLRSAPEFTIPGVGHGPALVIRMKDGRSSGKN